MLNDKLAAVRRRMDSSSSNNLVKISVLNDLRAKEAGLLQQLKLVKQDIRDIKHRMADLGGSGMATAGGQASSSSSGSSSSSKSAKEEEARK